MSFFKYYHIIMAGMSLAYCIGVHATLRTEIASEVSQLQKMASNSSVVNAVMESNKVHNHLTQLQLQLHKLNTAWHKQLKSTQQPLLKSMQARLVSNLLNQHLRESNGKIQKINRVLSARLCDVVLLKQYGCFP